MAQLNPLASPQLSYDVAAHIRRVWANSQVSDSSSGCKYNYYLCYLYAMFHLGFYCRFSKLLILDYKIILLINSCNSFVCV